MASIDLILVLDASGSMGPRIDDTVGGINRFLDDQRSVPGDAYVTLGTFDSTYRERFAARRLSDLGPISKADYYDGHGGSTALLDAVGTAIARYAALPVKADKTVFVITTDGMENASTEYTQAAVRSSIETHQAAGWAFVFLGADDSQWQGASLGTQSVGGYVNSPAGVARMYANTSANVRSIREAAAPASASSATLNWDTGDGEPAN